MITTSDSTLDIIDASASQNSGDACPSFSLTVKPHLGTSLSDPKIHFGWTPPSPLTITVDGLSWVCVPLDAPIRVTASEVTYAVTYYPQVMHTLRRAKLKKPAVWVSAPAWEVNVYLKDLDKKKYQVFTKDSDVYASNGWTVQEILESLGGIVGYAFRANFPTLHVSQKTVMCDENTAILDFVGSLLPSGFRFIWDMQTDGVRISLLAPPVSTRFTPPELCFSVEQATPPVETFDSVSITGAPYKLNTGLSFGNALGSAASVSTPAAYDEDLPDETGELNGQPTRTVRTRTIQPDPFMAPFTVSPETETLYVKHLQDQRNTTRTEYDNADPVLYETPRVTTTIKDQSGKTSALVAAAVTSANAALLTNKLQLLTGTEYLAIQSDKRPTILLSAFPAWQEFAEVVTDSKSYVTPETASKAWPEGCERSNTQTTVCKGYRVNGRFFKSALSASALLQEIAAMLQQTGKKTISSFAAATVTLNSTSRTLKLQGAGAYRFEERRSTLDQVTDEMHTVSAMLPVNSDPPTSPTRWRTAPLTAVLDKTSGRFGADAKLVFRLSGTVPTSNPSDFQVWAYRLFLDMTQPRRTYAVAVPSLLPCGAMCGGGMVSGWSCSQKGHVFSANLTVE